MGDLIWKLAKILWGLNFFLDLWGDKPLWGELKLYGRVIFITTVSLFHFFRNSQHPENEVFLLRISSGNVNASVVVTCQFTSSILLKNSLRKTSLFGLFELLPTGLFNYVWPFVTTQHEWANNFPSFLAGTLMNKLV